jgi:hypothetical protein
MTTCLQDALRDLAEVRRQYAIAKDRTEEHLKCLKATTAYQELSAAQDSDRELSLAMGALEVKVRELAMKEHVWSGEYKPADGVQIKEFTRAVYKPEDAWEWCAEHALKYLVLDIKAFENAASLLRYLGAPVELTKEARVTIATDLGAWLPTEQMEGLLASEEIELLREEQDLAEKQS